MTQAEATQIATLTAEVRAMRDDLSEIKKAVTPLPAYEQRIKTLETNQDNYCKATNDRLNTISGRMWWVIGILVVALLGALITIAFSKGG